MLKRAALLFALTLSLSAADLRVRFTGPTLDVYVSESVERSADIPDAPPASNHLIVSVKTADESAVAVMIRVVVRLDDQTRIARTAVAQRTGDARLVFRFPLGERRAVEVVDIHVDNLRKTLTDVIVEAR